MSRGFVVILSLSLSLAIPVLADDCPTFGVLDHQPADPPALIELPPGLQPLEDVLLLIGITDLLGPPLTSTSSPPGGEGGGSGGGPQLHTASFIIPVEHGQLDIGLEWRIQRFGTYLEATVLATISPVEGVTLHQEYAGAFTLRREGDYELRYTGTLFSLDAPEPTTLEISGRLRSGVTADEAPGLVFETVLQGIGPMLIPSGVTLFDFVPEPEEGSPRTAGGPGFRYCGAFCECLLGQQPQDRNDCMGKNTQTACSAENCRDENSNERICNWKTTPSPAGDPLMACLGFVCPLGILLYHRGRGRRSAAPNEGKTRPS